MYIHKMKKYRADVIIIEASIAGITAAIELMNEWKSVVLLARLNVVKFDDLNSATGC